jgi:hypothetical protein
MGNCMDGTIEIVNYRKFDNAHLTNILHMNKIII